MEAIDYLKSQPEFTDRPITTEFSMFYYVAPAKVAQLMERYHEFEQSNSEDCDHRKRQYIPELNKDLCLICGVTFKMK